MEPAIDVVVPGRPTVDLLFSPLQAWPEPGREVYGDALAVAAGAHFNTAAALARLQVAVALVAVVGDDVLGELVLRDVRAERLGEEHVRVVAGVPTPLSVALNHAGDRGFVTYAPEHERAESALVAATQALLRTRRVRHVHADLSAGRRLLEAVRESGATLSVDAYDAGGALASADVAELVAAADVLFVNDAEARAMTRAPTAEAAARELAGRCPHVVVKHGARGASAYAAGAAEHAPGVPAELVDATGAGDCFAAGYLRGLLDGRPLATCLALANLCGAAAVRALGGYAGAPTLAELREAASAAGVELA